jgi:hypothetical protein
VNYVRKCPLLVIITEIQEKLSLRKDVLPRTITLPEQELMISEISPIPGNSFLFVADDQQRKSILYRMNSF